MSIQRYAVRKDALIREEQEFPPAFPHGYLDFVVTYADARAWVTAEREAALREALACIKAQKVKWSIDYDTALDDASKAIERLIDGGSDD